MLPDLVVALCLAAGCTLPVSWRIEPPALMPHRLIAHTTVERGACILHFTPAAAIRPEVIAHEVGHCALDSDVLGPFGYDGIPTKEASRRERAVQGLTKRLTPHARRTLGLAAYQLHQARR